MGVNNPVFARIYPRLAAAMERQGGAEHRRRLLDGLTGRVIEVGAGHGANFAYYPATVEHVLAVEPEPRLRAAARDAAARAAVPVEVVDGLADDLPADDGTFDAAVVSLVLCSVPDPRRCLGELARVLGEEGELRFYEHVRARNPRLARVQRGFDVVWPHLAGGCHTSRDTLGELEAAGFRLDEVERFRFPESRVSLPTSPHVLGRAFLRPSGA